MPAKQPVQHLYAVQAADKTMTSILATTHDEAIRLRRREILEAVMRRIAALEIKAYHQSPICPGCGVKPAAVSDLYPEAET